MEENLIKNISVCNGNAMVTCNALHKNDTKLQKALISNVLVFYVNGKEVCGL